MLLVYSAISSILMIMVVANLASGIQISDTQKAIGNSVYIRKVRINDTGRHNDLGRFNDEEIQKLSENKRVDSYNVVTKQGGNLRAGEPVMDKEKFEKRKEDLEEVNFDTNKLDNCTFIGVTDSQKAVFFSGTGFHMVKGNPITAADKEKEEVLVSEKLAELNNWNVGEIISLATTKYFNSVVPVEFKAKIKGIYACPEDSFAKGKETYSPELMLENYIFVPQTVLSDLDSVMYQPQMVFVYLKQYEMIPAYIKDMKNQLGEIVKDQTQTGWENEYRYKTNEEWNKLVSSPLKEIHNVTNGAMWIILAGVLAVVLLINFGEIQEKQKEFGVWMACGEKRIRILAQTLIEKMLPILIASAIGLWVGFSTADIVSPYIMGGSSEEMNEQMKEERNDILFYEGMYNMETELRMGNYNFFYLPKNLNLYRSRGIILGTAAVGCIALAGILSAQVGHTLHRKPSELLGTEE